MADLSQYDQIFKEAGDEWNVDPTLLKAMAKQESGGRTNAVSPKGAVGLMQIIPETQRYLGITDPNDPVQSIYGAAKYMNEALDKEGTPERALLYYHGGPGWRNAYGPESRAYVPAVTAHYVALKPQSADQPPPASTAPTPASAASTSQGPLILGDSLASKGGLGGSGVVGAHPKAVLDSISGLPDDQVKGRDVVLSSGASNNPAQAGLVYEQIQALKAKGANSVTVVGVGDRPDLQGANDQLAVATGRAGGQFVPLDTTQLSPDRVHPTREGYKTLLAAATPKVATDATPAPAAPTGAGKTMANDDLPSWLPAAPKPSAGVSAAPTATETKSDGLPSWLPPAPQPAPQAPPKSLVDYIPTPGAAEGAPSATDVPSSRPADDLRPTMSAKSFLKTILGLPEELSPEDKARISSPTPVERIIQAGREGWQNAPTVVTPEFEASIPQSSGFGLNRPLIAAGNLLLGAGSAALRGGQQFAQEATPDIHLPSLPPGVSIPLGGGRSLTGELTPGSLGREVAALPEAFPTGDYGQVTGPRAPAETPNPLLSPKFVSERMAPPREPGATDLERIQQLIRHDEAEQATANPLNRPAPEAPRPAAVGAEATTEPIPEKTRGQQQRDLETIAEQSAEDRAQTITKPGSTTPTLYDETPYVTDVPGGTLPPRILAERDFDPQTALDHKVSYREDAAYRSAVDERARLRNQGMTDLLRKDAGDKVAIETAENFRDEVSPRELGVFVAEKPVDTARAQALQARVNALLSGPEAKRGAIRSIFKDVADSLTDAQGNLETAPSQWYGARKNITDFLKKGKGTGEVADNVRAVKSILEDLLPDLDATITSGAPKYADFLREWHARSQTINQMTFLQQYLPAGSKSLYDKDGYLRFERVNAMIKDIIKERGAKGVAAAKSLTPEQIANIEAVRNELAAKSLRERMEKVGGSDTAQLLEAQAKRGQGVVGKAFRTGSDIALHSLGVYAAQKGYPGLNQALSIYQTVGRPMREARKLRLREEQAAAGIAEMKRRLLSDEPVNPLLQ